MICLLNIQTLENSFLVALLAIFFYNVHTLFSCVFLNYLYQNCMYVNLFSFLFYRLSMVNRCFLLQFKTAGVHFLLVYIYRQLSCKVYKTVHSQLFIFNPAKIAYCICLLDSLKHLLL